jgi:putative ABC transport system permease protein
MIKYHVLLFLRNMRRQKLFSTINLLGLTAGIVSTLLIYLYVQHELSYDRFHANADRIYRINQTFIWGEHDDHLFSSTGPGVAYALDAEIPEVEQVTRLHPTGNFLVSYTDTKHEAHAFDESKILAADSNFFSVFTFPLVKGSATTALSLARSVVLTEETARRYFGNEDPMGKLMEVKDTSPNGDGGMETYQVTGVVKNVPSNSYIDFDMLVSMNSFEDITRASQWNWIWTTFETFVLLDKHASPQALEAKLPILPRKYAETTLRRVMNQSFDDYTKNGRKWELFAQPLTSIRLYSDNIYNRLNSVSSVVILYVLSGVEIFIVLLSCINFMNLSTAQYTRRIKESSLRKILGSNRLQLASHFFVEALMFCVLAAGVGLAVTQLILPFFNALTGNALHLNLFVEPEILLILAALIVIMSALCGSYPAIFLSRFSPVEAMKGTLRTGKQGKVLRNGLVMFQFAISMVLIVCTVVVFQQLQFLANKDVGFDRDNLVVVKHGEWIKDRKTFAHALKNIQHVEEVAWSTSVPPRLYDGDQFQAEGHTDKTSSLNYVKADEQYVPTLKLELVLGRNFSKDIPADKERVILNENAVEAFGWNVDESVLGKKIFYPGMEKTYEVVGVVKDFHYWALSAPVQPMGIFHVEGSVFSNQQKFAVVRVEAGQPDAWRNVLTTLEKEWRIFAGDAPFQYEFVDEAFAEAFKGQEQFARALTIFAAMAILIACFGLLGMIIYTLEQRTKEIGIRKVVGASVWSIWVLVVREYTMLILVSVVVSTPLCIYLLTKWLETFEYKVPLTPWAFVLAAGSMLTTSIFITGYHVLKAALMNPVAVLKDE